MSKIFANRYHKKIIGDFATQLSFITIIQRCFIVYLKQKEVHFLFTLIYIIIHSFGWIRIVHYYNICIFYGFALSSPMALLVGQLKLTMLIDPPQHGLWPILSALMEDKFFPPPLWIYLFLTIKSGFEVQKWYQPK